MGDWLNYRHLQYFWTVVREGSVSAASRKLRLAQPTISEQLKELEQALGIALFHRRGGRLTLTDDGSHVYRYADEIFALGRELTDSVSGRKTARRSRLVVGIADVVPKLIVAALLAPALDQDPELRVVCYEDRHEKLMSELALSELDVVLSDTPVRASSEFRGYSRLLSESSVSLFADAALAERLRKNFPQSLVGAPLLLPIEHTSLRTALTRWFDVHDIQPRIRGEFQDSALAMVFGRTGQGVLAAPTAMAEQMHLHHRLAKVAELEDVRERFYAVTAERKISHPAVRAIVESAPARQRA
jgi:LysR family transcriptional activator of nhaA